MLTREDTAINLVSPAPLRLPVKITCEICAGAIKETIIIICAPSDIIDSESEKAT